MTEKGMKIAALPKSGTYLFKNLAAYLKLKEGVSIEIDHLLTVNRRDFIDDTTPTIVSGRDPRAYFFSLLNWYKVRSQDADWRARQDPRKLKRWDESSDDERMFAMVYNTSSSLMQVPSRDSYDCLIKATSKPNCYVALFENFVPQKDVNALEDRTLDEYVRMFGHLGITMDRAYAKSMLVASWGHSATWSPNKVDMWVENMPTTVQRAIIDIYQDVFDKFGYKIEESIG